MKRILTTLIVAIVLLQSFVFISPANAVLPVTAAGEAALTTAENATWRVTTLPVTNITIGSARVSASVPAGVCQRTVTFEYGYNRGVYPFTATGTLSGAGTYSAILTGLPKCTTIYVRPRGDRCCDVVLLINSDLLVAGVNVGGIIRSKTLGQQQPVCETAYGQEISFKTLGCGEVEGFSGTTATPAGIVSPAPRPFLSSVQTASLSTSKAGPGEPVTVNATVHNAGSVNGSTKITVYVNGNEAASQGITLSSGETRNYSFTVSGNEPGVYNVLVNNVPAGSFKVDYFTDNDILIYGLIALFAIGIGVTLFLVSRKRLA